jgi:rhomboid protease GluP
MDLNYIALWFIGVSCGAGLAVFLWRFRLRFKGWLWVLGGILAFEGIGLWLFPRQAGILAGVLWLVLFLVPIWGQHWVQRLMARQHFVAAGLLARILAVLHPADGWPAQPAYLEILAHLHRGDTRAARRLLDTSRDNGALAHFARLQLYRAEGQWRQAIDWIEEHRAATLFTDFQTLAIYVRALGELGRINEMLSVYAEASRRARQQDNRYHLIVVVLSLSGRHELVARLFAGPLTIFPQRTREFWYATSLHTAGATEQAAAIFGRLAHCGDPSLERAARRRLETPLASLADLSPDTAATLAHIESTLTDELHYGTLVRPTAGNNRLTVFLMLAITLAFLFELPGGTTDAQNLVDLGALVLPSDLVGGLGWRVATAAFLHYGALHYVLNIVGVWYLGRYMERIWGSTIVGACFLVPAIGANLMAAAVYEVGLVVGASGGVMGILGGLVALVAHEWRKTGVGLLRRHLLVFAALLALQIVFDAVTPNVSSTVHLSGLGIGFAIAALFAWRSRGSWQKTIIRQ